MTERLLELVQLSRRFDSRTVLDAVELSLDPGERLTIAGQSGTGKTTLLRLIAGLERPDAGEVRLEGRCASAPRAIRIPPWQRGVQMVFQNMALWPTRSVLAHVVDAMVAQGRSKSEARPQASEALKRVGLEAHHDRRPGTLSGGEARRLAFARALALQPKLLLLDEPFASLDPVAREAGLQWLEELLRESDTAVILVTHEAREARALGGAVAVLKDGHLDSPKPYLELCATEESFRTALEA